MQQAAHLRQGPGSSAAAAPKGEPRAVAIVTLYLSFPIYKRGIKQATLCSLPQPLRAAERVTRWDENVAGRDGLGGNAFPSMTMSPQGRVSIRTQTY